MNFVFSSIIWFFYQYCIGCDINKDKSLELYLIAINNEKFLKQNYTHIDNEFDILQNINITIGKYLLQFIYYKDIFLNTINFSTARETIIKCLKFSKRVIQLVNII